MAMPPRSDRGSDRGSGLVLGLSSDEDDDTDVSASASGSSGSGSSGNDVGAEGLSTTPSTSSESGSSSLDAHRTPPRPPRPRVAKRSLRGDLLERWPGWTSPARKRRRSSSAESTAPGNASDPGKASDPQADAHSGVDRHAAPVVGLLVREYDRFWKMVEKVAATSPPEDLQRLCYVHVGEEGDVTIASVLPGVQDPKESATDRDRTHDLQQAIAENALTPRATAEGLGLSGVDFVCQISTLDEEVEEATTPPSRRVREDPPEKSVILAVPDESQDDDVDILPPPSPFRRLEDAEERARVATPPERLGPSPAERDIAEQRVELMERLTLLAGRAPPSSEDADKADVEEDSSVLQLLVLTPTEERKLGPALGPAPGPSSSGPGRPGWTLSSKCKKALGCLLRLKIPYFFILLAIAQVTLYAAPTPYQTQELKNMFVWDSRAVLKEPWRAVSYAMLHSGQMHVTLNVGVQTFIGTPLEREQGALRVAAVYFGGAILGGLITGVISPNLLMVGASAGIYSILMSHLAHVWLNIGSERYCKTRAGAVLLLTSSDMAYTVHHALKRGNAAPRIGVTAHCAGAVGGLFLGLALYRTVPGRSANAAAATRVCCCCEYQCQWRTAKIGSVVILVLTAVFCLLWIRNYQATKALDHVTTDTDSDEGRT